MALTDNLISYWKLDETSGNASDSVGSNTLTNNGTVSYVSGKVLQGADFGTTGNTKSLRTSSTLGIDGGNISISAWVKKKANITSTKYCNAAYQKNGTSKVEYRLGIDNAAGSEKLTFCRGKIGVADNNAQVTTTLDLNWHHLVGTYDGTTVTLYLDGVVQGTVASSGAGSAVLYTDGFSLGNNNDNSSLIENNFIVDECGVWSRALSEAEVKQIYNSGVALPHPFTGALFAIWNKTDKEANITLSNGDLTATSGTTLWRNVRATIGKSTGKWYWEIKTTGGTIETMAAIGTSAATLGGTGAAFPGSDAVSYAYYGNSGFKYNSNSGVAYGATFTNNDVIGVALDMDAGTLTFYKNGVSQGQAYSGISGTFFPFLGLDASGQAVVANFGATPFDYPVPNGYNPGIFSGTYDTNMLKNGISAYYKLEDLTDSAGSNTLTNNGTVGFVGGKIGNAGDFGTANTTKFFSSGTAIVDTSTSGISTVAGWVNISTDPASGVDYELFGAIKSGGRQFEYKYSNIGGTRCLNLTVYDGSTATVYQRNTTLTVGQWYHIAFVIRGNTINIFQDGVQIGTIQTITNVANGSAANNFTLGRHPNASAGFSCSKADETGVWGIALNALDIKNLYNSGAGLQYPFTISAGVITQAAILLLFAL